MLLASFSKAGLDQMLRICYDYSAKWRYLYSVLKTAIIVFNESLSDYQYSNRSWELGYDNVEETTQYKHLGIHLDKFMTRDSNIKEASNKLRGTMLGLVNCGIHEHGLNPPPLNAYINLSYFQKDCMGANCGMIFFLNIWPN